MAYTDDWESLMNGVFGPGGKLKFSQSTPQAAQPKPEKPEKTQDSPLPDWNAALLARQKKLDEMLKQQNAALKGQDAATKSALEDSRKMLRDLEKTVCWPRARQTRSQSIWAALRGWPMR